MTRLPSCRQCMLSKTACPLPSHNIDIAKLDRLSVQVTSTVPSMDIEVETLLRDIRKMPTKNIRDMMATYNATSARGTTILKPQCLISTSVPGCTSPGCTSPGCTSPCCSSPAWVSYLQRIELAQARLLGPNCTGGRVVGRRLLRGV